MRCTSPPARVRRVPRILAAFAAASWAVAVVAPETLRAEPSFEPRTELPAGVVNFVTIGDVDGDRLPDLVFCGISPDAVSVCRGNGDGTFLAARGLVPADGFAWPPVALGDLNADGLADLVAVVPRLTGDAVFALLTANGASVLESPTSYLEDHFSTYEPAHLRRPVLGDVNGDGRPDLAVAGTALGPGYTVGVLLDPGNGYFEPSFFGQAGTAPSDIAIGDLDGDGRPDLAVSGGVPSGVSVLLGAGDGTFGAPTSFATRPNSSWLAIGDLNNDGHADLVTVNSRAGTEDTCSVSVLMGLGDGTFGPARDYVVAADSRSLAVADFDGDGVLDVATANPYLGTVSVLPGLGSGELGPKRDFPAGDSPGFVAAGDVNRDGAPDLVVTNWQSPASLLLNASPGLPTATLVERFSADATAEGVRIEWRLHDPGAAQSIRLRRADSEEGPWAEVQQAPELRGTLTIVLDAPVPAGIARWYRLEGTLRDGGEFHAGPIPVMGQATITTLALSAPAPNPTTKRSSVRCSIPTSAHVRLALSDLQGREVAVLADEFREAGSFTTAVESGGMRPGIYFLRLQADGRCVTRRVIIAR